MDEQIPGNKKTHLSRFVSFTQFPTRNRKRKKIAKILICLKSHIHARRVAIRIRTATTATATISRTSGANDRTGAETLAKREAEELKEKLTD